VPTDWQFEVLTKQIEQLATPPAPRGKFQPRSHNNRPQFDMLSTATFRRYQRDFDLSNARRINTLSRTAQNTRHTLPAWIQAQYDELNAPRPPPTPWVPFRWGPATISSNVTDDSLETAATQPRPDSTWPVGQFIIQLLFPDGEQENYTIVVSGLLPILALERQLGKLVGYKEAAIYVEPNWERLHRLGYITDRVLPNTTIPCPYLTYMTRVRVQHPPIPHETPTGNPSDENQSSSSVEQTNIDLVDRPMVLYNYISMRSVTTANNSKTIFGHDGSNNSHLPPFRSQLPTGPPIWSPHPHRLSSMAAHLCPTNTLFTPAMPKCSLKPLRFTKQTTYENTKKPPLKDFRPLRPALQS
jgi:hypothetical protein